MNLCQRHLCGAALAVAGAVALNPVRSEAEPLYQTRLTTSGYSGSTALADFPVLVRLSESAGGFSYADCAADGADISFALDDGTVLAHEIDTWNPSGTSFAWVRLPALASSSDSFLLRWCDSAPPANRPADVWGASGADAGYAGVWHFGEEGGVAHDATGHGLDGTPTIASDSMGVEGLVGRCRYTKTPLRLPRGGDLPSPVLKLGDTLTFSGWFRFADNVCIAEPKYPPYLFYAKNAWDSADGWAVNMHTGNSSRTSDACKRNVVVNARIGSPSPIDSMRAAWVHLVVVMDGASARVYSNGIQKWESTIPSCADVLDSVTPLLLSSAYNGYGDEIRIRDGAVTADWAKAEYETMANASFLTFGQVEKRSAGGIAVVSSGAVRGATVPPCGSYVANPESGRAYAFSCPSATVPLGGDSSAVCAGWELRSLSDGSLLRSSEDRGESPTSFVHVHDGRGVRVVWKWDARYVVGDDDSPRYRALLTASGYAGTDTLFDFPVLVRISESTIPGFNYGACAADGFDVSFTLEDGTVLAHEIDTWDPTGTSLAWVRLPALVSPAGSGATRFHMRWSDPSPPAATPAEVWRSSAAVDHTSSRYAGVWHFNEAAGTAFDSTANGIDGEPTGNDTGNCVRADAAPTGRGRYVPEKCYVSLPQAPTSPMAQIGVHQVFSGWFKYNPDKAINNNNSPMLIYAKSAWNSNNDGWYVCLQWTGNSDTTKRTLGVNGLGDSPTTVDIDSIKSDWVHIAVMFDTFDDVSYGKVYSQGVQKGTFQKWPWHVTVAPALLSGNFDGYLDEVRIHDGVVSADWIKAEYDTVANPAFLVYGAAERRRLANCGTIIMVR